jgi:hypothetical protein
MKHQRGETALLALGLLSIVAVVIIGFILENASCKSKWERSGMAGVMWGPIQGCLVKLPDGRWLPEERIREIEIPREPKPAPKVPQ